MFYVDGGSEMSCINCGYHSYNGCMTILDRDNRLTKWGLRAPNISVSIEERLAFRRGLARDVGVSLRQLNEELKDEALSGGQPCYYRGHKRVDL